VMLKGRQKSISEILREKIYVAGCEAQIAYDKAVSAILSNNLEGLDEVFERKNALEKLDEEIAVSSFLEEKSAEAICACCALRDSILRIADYSADIAEIAINRSYKPL
jgi:uncharacterized protein with PhoU and TrkA domain